jgi:hypothetical protein
MRSIAPSLYFRITPLNSLQALPDAAGAGTKNIRRDRIGGFPHESAQVAQGGG